MRSGLSSIHTTTSSTTTTQEEAVAQIEGLSRRIRSTARIFSSTSNQPTNCVELVGAKIILSAPRSNLAKSARPDYQQCQRNLIFDNNRPKQMLLWRKITCTRIQRSIFTTYDWKDYQASYTKFLVIAAVGKFDTIIVKIW